MPIVSRALGYMGLQRVPPKLPAEPLAAPTGAAVNPLAWSRRVAERIVAEQRAGRLRLPPYLDCDRDASAAALAYDQMLAEPMALAPLRLLVDSVSSLDLQVLPIDPRDPRQQTAAEYVRHLFDRCAGGKRAMVEAVALPGQQRGWSLTDKVLELETEPPFAGKWVWGSWKSKDTKNLTIHTDQYRNVTGIEGRSTDNKTVLYDPEDFVLYSHLKLFEDPRGRSAFRAAYDAWYRKQAVQQLWSLHIQKWGSPFLKGTYTDQSAELDTLASALQAAEGNTWIAVPKGTLVEVVAAASGSTGDYQAFLDRCDKAMSIAIMGSHLPILEGSNVNVAGSTKEQRSTSELRVWALADELGRLFGHHAAQMVRLNYAGVVPPRVFLSAISEIEIQATLANDKLLHDMGVPLSLADLRKRSYREPPADPADTLAGPAAPAPVPAVPFAEGEQSLPPPPSWALGVRRRATR